MIFKNISALSSKTFDNPGKRLYIVTYGWPMVQVARDDFKGFRDVTYFSVDS